MNKLYTSLVLVITALALMSNSGGRGTVGGEAVTGAGGQRTCAASGCHDDGQFSPTLSVELLSPTGGESEFAYKPGIDYTARLTIDAAGTPGGYGFQMVAINEAGASVGSWTPTDGIQTVDIGGRSYIEQSQRLTESIIEFQWLSPDTDEGNITFFVAANAVNGTGSPAGDGSANIATVFAFDDPSSTGDESLEEIQFFPNPALDILNVTNHNSDNFSIYNVQGLMIKQGGINNDQINISDLNPGMYVVKLDNEKQISRFIKI